MKIDDVKTIVINANWFSSLGLYPAQQGKVRINDLHAWDSNAFSASVDPEHARISEMMDWLPTTKDQEDPIYGTFLLDEFKKVTPESRLQVMDLYKEALKSLRHVSREKLVSGSNDFTEAAIGAALYCSRMAAIEVAIGKQEIWCHLLGLYGEGHWPCGRMPNGDIVVY